MEKERIIHFAEQVARYVVLVRRADGVGGAYQFRYTPIGVQQKQVLPINETSCTEGLSVVFDNGMRVFVGVFNATGTISLCCLFGPPSVPGRDRDEWVAAEDTAPVSCSIAGDDLALFSEKLREREKAFSLLRQGAEQRARVLPGLFKLSPETGELCRAPRKAEIKSCEIVEINPYAIEVVVWEGDGTIHETRWGHKNHRITRLDGYTMVYHFSGDPGGETTPIGQPERVPLKEMSLSDINNEVFYTEP
jgi:hypothetical protein